MRDYSSNRKKTIAVVGAGEWGKNLLRVFSQLGVLKTICDINRNILRERGNTYPDAACTTKFERVLNDGEIRGVVIAAPASQHYRLAQHALEAGKDVFVEKPLALQLDEGNKLVQLARTEKRILMVGHVLRYHPATEQLRKLIETGKLGEIQYIWSNRLAFGRLRREENVLWSFAPHDISILIDFLGMPKRVTSVGSKSYTQKNIPDTVLTFFEFKNNKTAHIFGSWLNPFKEQKLAVIGTKNMAVFDGVKNELMVYPHKIKTYQDRDPRVIKAEGEKIPLRKIEALMEEAKHFVMCMKKRITPKTSGEEGVLVLRVLEASQQSLTSNKSILLS